MSRPKAQVRDMAANWTVRTATPGDLAGIDALLARSYPALLKADYPASVLVTAIPLISRANPRLLASGSYFVVETAAGDIVGAGGWTRGAPMPGTPRGRSIGHVRHVATDPRQTRKGVGRALMDRVFATARDAGIGQLECHSTFTAQPFYEACGFHPIKEITVPLRPGIDFPAVHMRRLL